MLVIVSGIQRYRIYFYVNMFTDHEPLLQYVQSNCI